MYSYAAVYVLPVLVWPSICPLDFFKSPLVLTRNEKTKLRTSSSSFLLRHQTTITLPALPLVLSFVVPCATRLNTNGTPFLPPSLGRRPHPKRPSPSQSSRENLYPVRFGMKYTFKISPYNPPTTVLSQRHNRSTQVMVVHQPETNG